MTTLPHLRDREKEGREREKDALYIILCLIILLIEMKIEGCKLHIRMLPMAHYLHIVHLKCFSCLAFSDNCKTSLHATQKIAHKMLFSFAYKKNNNRIIK